MGILRKFVEDKISRKDKKKNGRAVGIPYLKTIGGQESWVVDVMTQADEELMIGVVVAASNREIKNAVNYGSPVELQRDAGGFWFVSGRSSLNPTSTITKKTYSVADYNIAFTEGLKIKSGGGYETENGNIVDPGSSSSNDYYYIFETIPLGDLNFGVTPLEAKRATRVNP